jgi:uncharacterized protein
VKVWVKVQPRSSRDEILFCSGSKLKIYLKASPVDGKANKDLIEILAKHFKVKKTDIHIVTGKKSRNKLVEILNAD